MITLRFETELKEKGGPKRDSAKKLKNFCLHCSTGAFPMSIQWKPAR
jgi:hypothetical protein